MARKKAATRVKRKSVKRKRTVAAKKTKTKKKAARRSKKQAKKKKTKPAKKTASRKKPATRKASRKKTATKKPKSLGRPRVTADAKLDHVFQKDYQAREIFEFLGVTTIRELEVYGPAEIVDRLTAPMVQTVQRIRKTLALVNRCLANDRQFALDFKIQLGTGR